MNVKLKTRLRVVPAPNPACCTGCYFKNKKGCVQRAHVCSPNGAVKGDRTQRMMIFKEVVPNGN